MTISFKEYHAQNNPGNYVSVDVAGLPTQLVASLPGDINPSPHITLMYSKESAVPLAQGWHVLNRYQNLIGTTVKVSGAEIFSALDHDAKKGCIVLTLDDPRLMAIYEKLTSYGMKHSYPTFSQHATLIYNVDIDRCNEALPGIKEAISNDSIILTFTKFNNNWVIDDWV